ncbi:MAG: CHAT domain-containing protein [Caldilineaceae bacterium]|nr:CHAT domain-containing protein [Caldilineaceae bacterium]
MDRTTVTQLRNFLVRLYGDAQSIRRVLDDAGLDAARIHLGGSALNSWHGILDEAQKQAQIDPLLDAVLLDYPNRRAELEAIVGTRRSTQAGGPTPGDSPTASQQPTPPTSPAATPQAGPDAPAAPSQSPEVELPRSVRLQAVEIQLVRLLFAKATKVRVSTEFTDGRTATRVLLARPVAADGVTELPAVIKLGPRALIEPEWQAAQNAVLGRLPGSVKVDSIPIYFVDETGAAWGALRYAQVGDGIFDVESLSRYATHATLPDLWQVLNNRLFRQLGELWHTTQQWQSIRYQQRYDRILPVNLTVVIDGNAKGFPLLLDAAYLATADEFPPVPVNSVVRLDGFVVTEASADGRQLTLDLPAQADTAYRLRLQRPANDPPVTIGERYPTAVGRVQQTRQQLLQAYLQPTLGTALDLSQPTVPLPDGTALPNPLLALPLLLARRQEGWLATIHGDLNLRNILVDPEARTTHIIDCAAARQDHLIQDLLRLERDLLTDLAAQIFFTANLPPTAMVDFYRALHCACRGEFHTPGYFALPTGLEPALEKLFLMLVMLRQAARERLAVAGEWDEYYTGLVIHLLGALKFRDLDHAPPGHQPKALAFWGAAALVGVLQDPAATVRFCHTITWRPFPIQGGPKGGNAHGGEPILRGQATSGDPAAACEAFPSKGVSLPSDADRPPVQRRLDVAAPTQATLQRAFLLAVAVRQNSSPPLAISTLPVQQSGQAQLDWPESEPFVRLRVQVEAAACTLVGESSYTFKLYRNLDSEIYYFSLIPQVTGPLTIIVRLYQEGDLLGSTFAQTSVSEQVVGEVPVQIHSSEPVTPQTRGESQRTLQPEADRQPIKILFLAANPLDTVRLGIDEEARAIDLALRQAEHRTFAVATHQAVRIDDLQELLLRHQPNILHFSGHGAATNALILQDAQGNSMPVRGAALGRLLRVLKDNLRCVVLNACYTADNAAGLAAVIDCVVGIEDVITDSASRQFATAFYRALGYGRSIQEAFELGQVQIELAGLGEAEALHLHENRPAAAQLRFAGQQSPMPAQPRQNVATAAPITAPATERASPPAEDTDLLRSLLAQHQRNRQRLLQQKAIYGAGEEPLRLLNQLDAEEEAIAKLQQQLGQ